LKPEIHPAADEDIDRQYEWLRHHYCSPETLHKFLDAIEEAKVKIGSNPETWSKVAGSNKVRKVQIKSFRMTAFYISGKTGFRSYWSLPDPVCCLIGLTAYDVEWIDLRRRAICASN